MKRHKIHIFSKYIRDYKVSTILILAYLVHISMMKDQLMKTILFSILIKLQN